MKTFALEFLGCKVNQYEMQALREGLLGLGLREAAASSGADLYVLNTCSVTAHAGATSRKHVRRALRRNAESQVLVTGCYAESDRDVVAAIPGVSRIFGNAEKDDILAHVAHDLLARPRDLPLPPVRMTGTGGRTRAFVKIEDGCEDSCAFCIIPQLRGPARGRPADDILHEVGELVRNGCLEVVLTGVHLGYYGRGEGPRGRPLLDLITRIAGIPGLARLKLSSVEVQELSDELIDLFARHAVLSPHFHVPLQSGSDRTLARMRRKYRASRFLDRVAALRARLDAPALSTDVIVGFPGETEDDFQETLDVCRRAEFMKVHVFPYSVREGTEAADLPGHLPPAVIEDRKQRLLALDTRLGAAWRERFLGQVVDVLVEARRTAEGRLTGLTERYVRVDFEGPDALQGALVPVRVGASGDGAVLLGDAREVGASPS